MQSNGGTRTIRSKGAFPSQTPNMWNPKVRFRCLHSLFGPNFEPKHFLPVAQKADQKFLNTRMLSFSHIPLLDLSVDPIAIGPVACPEILA